MSDFSIGLIAVLVFLIVAFFLSLLFDAIRRKRDTLAQLVSKLDKFADVKASDLVTLVRAIHRVQIDPSLNPSLNDKCKIIHVNDLPVYPQMELNLGATIVFYSHKGKNHLVSCLRTKLYQSGAALYIRGNAIVKLPIEILDKQNLHMKGFAPLEVELHATSEAYTKNNPPDKDLVFSANEPADSFISLVIKDKSTASASYNWWFPPELAVSRGSYLTLHAGA